MLDGELVVPAMIENRVPVSCQSCGDTMYTRGGESRARHFYHADESIAQVCPSTSPGESSTHARCVALAVATLKDQFGQQVSRCAAEVNVDVSESGSGNRIRRADALVEFEMENPYFGDGLVIEVQHRNHDKNVRMATHDFISAGYSVAWLSSDDFGEEALDYAVVNEAFDSDDGGGYNVRNYSPRGFLKCEHYHYSGEHRWGTVPSYVLTVEEDYEICLGRDCTLRRQYDEERGEHVYDLESITQPDLPVEVLKSALVRRDTVSDFREWLTQRFYGAPLEKALAERPEIDECPGPKGFHEWGAPESHYGGYTRVELRACQYCPVHLLSDLRGYSSERTDVFFSEAPDPEWDLLSIEADPSQCDHECHDEGRWVESCPECGVSDP